MVLDFAIDFISMGEDIAEKQDYLNCAVSAWNMACLDESQKKCAIKKYMKEYHKLNPTHSKKDLADEKENILLLIEQKEKLYPKVKVQILDAQIEEIAGKTHITVASASVK